MAPKFLQYFLYSLTLGMMLLTTVFALLAVEIAQAPFHERLVHLYRESTLSRQMLRSCLLLAILSAILAITSWREARKLS
jgi:hypothetical protein